MLESTPRSTLYHVCNRRYERSCKKVFDLDFQGHAMKMNFFVITVGFLDPENIPMRNIFKKFGREGKNPGGLHQPPLGRFRLAKYLGHLRVNTYQYLDHNTARNSNCCDVTTFTFNRRGYLFYLYICIATTAATVQI